MDVLTTLRTTGATRAFTTTPVPRSTVHAILDDARFAPSGGNRQPWRVALVEDPSTRRRMATLMQPVWDEYVAAVDTHTQELANPRRRLSGPSRRATSNRRRTLIERQGREP